MPYKTRNTIVLSSFIALILFFDGYFIMFSYPQAINKTETEIKDIEQQIRSLEGIEDEFKILQDLIRKKQERLSGLDKRIVPEVTPAQTYHYLNRILARTGFLEFNILFNGSKTSDGYGYNIYHIKGEGPFYKIYNFIWYLERGPEIYKIKSLNLRGVESKDPETNQSQLIIPFEMEVWGYFAELKDLPTIRNTLNHVRVPDAINPFYPYILSNLPPNIDNLIEIERAELKALVPGKALIADYSGKIHTLTEGDNVYLGVLSKIDAENNRVEFSLNKGGIYEKFILKLKFDNTAH